MKLPRLWLTGAVLAAGLALGCSPKTTRETAAPVPAAATNHAPTAAEIEADEAGLARHYLDALNAASLQAARHPAGQPITGTLEVLLAVNAHGYWTNRAAELTAFAPDPQTTPRLDYARRQSVAASNHLHAAALRAGFTPPRRNPVNAAKPELKPEPEPDPARPPTKEQARRQLAHLHRLIQAREAAIDEITREERQRQQRRYQQMFFQGTPETKLGLLSALQAQESGLGRFHRYADYLPYSAESYYREDAEWNRLQAQRLPLLRLANWHHTNEVAATNALRAASRREQGEAATVKFLREQAAAGSARAKHDYGLRLLAGLGVEADPGLGRAHIQAAAALGLADAQEWLAAHPEPATD